MSIAPSSNSGVPYASVPPRDTADAAVSADDPSVGRVAPPGERYHRIAEVRVEQGMSLRTAARHLHLDTRTVRQQESASSDLRLSELRRWQQVLDVPLVDLVEDPGATLSAPVLKRAQLLRAMKTAAAILEMAKDPAVGRMAQVLVDQLVEIMPELAEVSPWHSVGQRRSLEELGRVVERRLRDDFYMVYRDE